MQDSRITAWVERARVHIGTPTPSRSWWLVVVCASVAAFLIAAFVSPLLMRAPLLPDYLSAYHPGAVGIQKGLGYVGRSGEFITRWPPGWSVFISPWVVDDPTATVARLRVVAGCLNAAFVVLLALVSRLLLPRVSIAWVLAIAAFWPPMLAAGNPMASEMLFVVLCTVGLYFLIRLYRLPPGRIGGTIGVAVLAWPALSAAALTKTTGVAVAAAVLFAIAVGFHDWSVRRRALVALGSAAVFSIALTPWVVTFTRHVGHVGFTSNGFISVRHGLQRYPEFPLGEKLRERSEGWRSFDDMWPDVRDLVADDPLGAARLIGMKLIGPWYATWTRRFDAYLLVVQAPWLVLFILTSGRTLWRWRRTPGDVILLHAFVGALWLTAALVAPLLRYLTPAFPFVVVLTFWHAVDARLIGNPQRERSGERRVEIPPGGDPSG